MKYISLTHITKMIESIKQRRRVRGRALTSIVTVGVRQRSSLPVGVLRPSAFWESVFLLQQPGKDSEGQQK